MDGTPDSFSLVSKTLLKFGVTGYLATTVTMDKPHISRVLEALASWKSGEGEAEVLGVHLEGPWICSHYKGAQNPDYIQIPQAGDGKWAHAASKGKLRIVTLAPEQPGALTVIQELVKEGVIVSIGHTNATYEQVEKAVDLGASHITHTFNAMRGLHHREPGVVGAALGMEQLHCEVIVDGLHVHPKAVDLLVKIKGVEKTLLVSDGMSAVDMPDGEYDLGGLKVTTHGGKAMLDDGTLAGSVLTLNRAVMNSVNFAKLPIWQAVAMASLNPAKRLGLDAEMGSIEAGKRANLVAVDEDGTVQQVWIDGEEQWKHN
jgi:N-acetylglucosamine-6-phosphate deacetylase